MKILITGVGSTIGYGILKCLKKSNIEADIIGADYLDTAVGLYLVDHSYILPDILKDNRLEADWLAVIKSLITKENINYVFVGLDFEVPLFAKYKDEIESESKCTVVVSSSRIVEICNDKWLTFLFLVENGYAAPKSCLPEDVLAFRKDVAFPWIIKPRIGSASNNLFNINTDEELSYALRQCKNAIIQEEVGKSIDEFTCGIISTETEIISTIALRRTLKNGNTQMAIYEENAEVDNYIREVAKSLKGFGPINIQLRLTDGGPKIFEINPRFSGTTAVRCEFGLNEVKVFLDYHCNGVIDSSDLAVKEGVVLRPAEEIFINISEFGSAKRL